MQKKCENVITKLPSNLRNVSLKMFTATRWQEMEGSQIATHENSFIGVKILSIFLLPLWVQLVCSMDQSGAWEVWGDQGDVILKVPVCSGQDSPHMQYGTHPLRVFPQGITVALIAALQQVKRNSMTILTSIVCFVKFRKWRLPFHSRSLALVMAHRTPATLFTSVQCK